MDNRAVLTDYVRRMTGALMMADVKAVVISPGSRSTPLAYAFASTEDLDVYMQVDERWRHTLRCRSRERLQVSLSSYYARLVLQHRTIIQQ